MNTHRAAAATPARMVIRLMESVSTMPVPTTLATAVPERAPARFMSAARITALVGERTRVETTVAMALAASLKPLTKSKRTAIAMTARRRVRDVSVI